MAFKKDLTNSFIVQPITLSYDRQTKLPYSGAAYL